jgi:transcriptional regulator with XRE-family HTH domain
MPAKKSKSKKRKGEIFEDLRVYFGRALVHLRGNKSRESIAKSAGMDAGTLARVEKGESPLRQDYVAGVLQSLDRTLPDLLRTAADCYQEAHAASYHLMSRDELLRSLRKLHETRARLERDVSEIDLEIKRRQIPDVDPAG